MLARVYYKKVSELSGEEIENIDNELTFTPRVNTKYAPAKFHTPVKLMTISEDGVWVVVPKFYGLSTFGIPAYRREFRGETQPKLGRFTAELKDEFQQTAAVAAVLAAYNKQGGGVLVLPCGYGKTLKP